MNRVARKKTLIVRRRPQLAALASPVRREILDHVRRRGPRTVAEVATGLGRKQTSIYYHVNQLVEVGLLVVAGERPGPARPEAVYAAVAADIRVEDPGASRATAAIAARSAGATLRRALREVEAGLKRKAGPTPRVGRHKARLRPAAEREVLRHLEAVERIFEREAEVAQGRFFVLTTAFASVPEKK